VSFAKRTARNSVYSVAAFLYASLATAIVTPIFVHKLGTSLYGVFTLTTVAISFLGALDFGVGTSLVKFLSEHLAKGEMRTANKLIGSSIVFYATVGAAGALMSALLAAIGPEHVFNVPASEVRQAAFAFAIAGVGFFFAMLSKVFSGIPLAVQRYDIPLKLGLALNTLNAGVSILLLYNGYGLRAVVLVTAAVEVTRTISYALIAQRLLPEIRFRPGFDREVFGRLARFSGYLFVASLSAMVLFQLDRIFIGALAGVAALAYYYVPGSLAGRIHGAIANLAAVTIPVSSQLFAKQELTRLKDLYLRATRTVVVALLSISIPPFILADKLLYYWIGPDFAQEGTAVLRILVVTYAFLALTVVPWNLVVGVGRPRIPAVFNSVLGGLNVLLMVVLIPPFGIVGAAVAYLVSTLPFVWLIGYVERRILEISSGHWAGVFMRLAVPAAAQCAACFALRSFVGGLGSLIVALLISAPVLAIVFYGLGFSERDDRDLLLSLLQVRSR
jgi:O-antigen/teichoic acid export membrane protein